jgi:RNA-directed DNA polymerase
MSESRHQQLFFAFADSLQGGETARRADASAFEAATPHTAEKSQRSESTSPPGADTGRLLEQVAAPVNLAQSLRRVVRNKGAPGVDGQSVETAARNARVLLKKLRAALLTETYLPGDVRRVWIPKPGGGQRGLGIPNVVDRVVQVAVLQVLEPIFEPHFHPSSHGFRPGRGTKTAIVAAVGHQAQGRVFAVDIDLEKFFDRVNHQRLLDRLGQRVGDERILRLVRLMLKTKVVMPDGCRVSTEEGTPQGGPLSPLLSNIVLDELDWELSRRGLAFVRYADDCNVYVKSERAGKRVMASLRRFLSGRLRLKINEAKSAVARAVDRPFLGLRVGASPGGWRLVLPSLRSYERLRTRIRELTARTRGESLATCTERINRYLRGWSNYFGLCTKDIVKPLKHADAHIRRRLRAMLVRHKKRPRHLFRALCARGVSRASAARTAYGRRGPWWQSNTKGMQLAYSNDWFGEQLVSLPELWYHGHHDWYARKGRSS